MQGFITGLRTISLAVITKNMYKTYTIKKGRHYSKPFFKFKLRLCRTKKMFYAIFSDECWWDKPRNKDDYDINKLCGFSFGYHRKNSIRIGWIPDFKKKNEIKIYAYWYNGSNKHQSQYLCNVQIGRMVPIKLSVFKGKAIFQVDAHYIFRTNFKLKKMWPGYYLYPYFGGNNTSPHEMKIYLA